MNIKDLAQTAVLVAHASKLTSRTALFLQSAELLQEYMILTKRLTDQVQILTVEVTKLYDEAHPNPVSPAVSGQARDTAQEDSGSASGVGGTEHKA